MLDLSILIDKKSKKIYNIFYRNNQTNNAIKKNI